MTQLNFQKEEKSPVAQTRQLIDSITVNDPIITSDEPPPLVWEGEGIPKCDFADIQSGESLTIDYSKSDKRKTHIKNQNARRIQRLKGAKSDNRAHLTTLKSERKERLAAMKMDPHSGFNKFMSAGKETLANTWASLASGDSDPHTDFCVSLGEDFLALFFALQDCTTTSQYIGIMTLYVKARTKDVSLIRTIVSAFVTIFDDITAGLEGSLDTQSSDPETNFQLFMKSFSQVCDNFTAVTHSVFAEKIQKIISMLLAIGALGDSKTLSVDLKGLNLFTVHASKAQVGCTDLIGVILSTLKFFVERGYKCFTHSSIKPLFFDHDIFETEYADIVGNFQYAKLGEWRRSPWVDGADFDLKLTEITDKCSLLMKASSDFNKKYFASCLIKLKTFRAEYDLTATSGGLRKAPFAFLVHGNSSIGKSTIVNNLVTFTLQQFARLEGKEDYIVPEKAICTLNEADKYHSDYKGYIQAVVLDDLANGKPEYTEANPTTNIVNFINNISRTAVVAEADLKGKLALRPKVVAASSNLWASWARIYSGEPLSALRRFLLHIHAEVNEDYVKNHTNIDGAKLAAAAAVGDITPDAWKFSVYQFVGVPEVSRATDNQATHVPQPYVQEPIMFMKKGVLVPALDIGMSDLLQILKVACEDHHHIQTSVLNTSKKVFKRQLCPHGTYPEYCEECVTTNGECCLKQQSGDNPPDNPFEERWAYVNFAFHMFQISGIGSLRTKKNEFLVWLQEHKPVVDRAYAGQGLIPPSLLSFNTYFNGQNYARLVSVYELSHTRVSTSFTSAKNSVTTRTEGIVNEINTLHALPWTKSTTWIPPKVFNSDYFQYGYVLAARDTWQKDVRNLTLTVLCAAILCHRIIPGIFPVTLVALPAMIFGIIEQRKELLMETLANERNSMPYILKRIRDCDLALGKKLFYFAGGLTALYTTYKMCKKLNTLSKPFNNQGNGIGVYQSPTNEWLQAEPVPLPRSCKCEDSITQLEAKITRAVVYVNLGNKFCNGFWVDTGMLLLPGHEMPTTNVEMKIIGKPGHICGSNFACTIGPKDCLMLESPEGESDLMLVYVPRSGPKANNIRHFPSTINKKLFSTKSFWRAASGEIRTSTQKVHTIGPIQAGTKRLENLSSYKTSEPTFAGQCMEVHLFNHEKNCFISGFHIAGKTGETIGASHPCTQDMLRNAKTELSKRSVVMFGVSEGDLETVQYGIDFTPVKVLPAKSPVNFQTECQADIYGHMKSYATSPKSAVIISPISKVVEEVTGKPRQHGKPANCRRDGDEGEQVRSWAPYQTYLAGAGNAYQDFPTDVLEWAFDDYVNEFDEMHKTPAGKELLSHVRKLSETETVSGVDGMSFVDAMKPNTSMGMPINKPKKQFLVDLHDEQSRNEFNCPRTLDLDTLSMAERSRELWLEAKRSYDIFKACTKDEPTKFTKKGVRVFQAAPIALQFNIRQLCLTICHYLSNASLVSECAVGIDSHGKGWHELNVHMNKYGEDNVVAGDFKAYDQHMSSKMTLLAFKVFEHIGAAAGYTDDDLKLMRGLATEVCYPLMSLNGDLVQLYGSNPSGQNLTVYINSIVNSLYHRCAFRSIYPTFEGRFTEAVALQTYGDDVKMSVNPAFMDYNHTNIQKVFSTRGIQYTMADKTAESVPFIRHVDADFLKRKSRWEPAYSYTQEDGTQEDGMHIGMLDEDSIFKSLHSNLASDALTPIDVSIQCLDGAMREYFFYGPTKFNEMHIKFLEIVDRMNIRNSMPDSFFMTYEVRELKWLEEKGVTKR